MMPDMSSSTCLRCVKCGEKGRNGWIRKQVLELKVGIQKEDARYSLDFFLQKGLNTMALHTNPMTTTAPPPCSWDIAMKVQLLKTALELQPGDAIGILSPPAPQVRDQGPFFWDDSLDFITVLMVNGCKYIYYIYIYTFWEIS